MEHRYKLTGLNETDVLEYVDILLELYGFSCYYTDERKKEIFIEQLHSNPLAIKWFVKCLYAKFEWHLNSSEQDELSN